MPTVEPPPPLTGLGLPILRARVTMRLLADAQLPAYQGAMLRGGFGYAFKRASCAQACWNHPNGCAIEALCPYRWIFETPHPPSVSHLHDLQDVPRPFVIEPPHEGRMHYPAGAALEFGLVLIGRGIDHLPYFLFSFEQLGRMGLGGARVPARLERVEALRPWQPVGQTIYQDGRVVARTENKEQRTKGPEGPTIDDRRPTTDDRRMPDKRHETSDKRQDFGDNGQLTTDSGQLTTDNGQRTTGDGLPLYDAAEIMARAAALPADLRLALRTPLRVKARGAFIENIDLGAIVQAACWRLNTLATFHGAGPWDVDHRALVALAREVVVEQAQARWVDWERTSSRGPQPRSMKLGGIVGGALLRGVHEPLRAVLLAGSLVHVGKACVFGHGEYVVSG